MEDYLTSHIHAWTVLESCARITAGSLAIVDGVERSIHSPPDHTPSLLDIRDFNIYYFSCSRSCLPCTRPWLSRVAVRKVLWTLPMGTDVISLGKVLAQEPFTFLSDLLMYPWLRIHSFC